MSIDSYDWLHRTGANPPNEPSTVICDNRPAQPFKYEAIFAHEYQHLLEYWASPGETTWANEGLADYVITVTGYGFPSRSIFETGYEGHIQTFLGWRALQTPANLIPQPKGGAENSLTPLGGSGRPRDARRLWRRVDVHGVPRRTLRHGLHDRPAQRGRRTASPGVQANLDKYLTGDKAQDVVHDWAAMVALDKATR